MLAPGHFRRERPLVLDAIQVFDVVPPAALPDQLVAEAERVAAVPVALYVLDIDGSHLLRIAGAKRLPDQIEAPLAVGPELDSPLDLVIGMRERAPRTAPRGDRALIFISPAPRTSRSFHENDHGGTK